MLIDNSFYYHMDSTLRQCHNTRINLYYHVLNIGIFLLFVLIFGVVLYFCYINKKSDADRINDIHKDQQYVLSKIKFYKDEMDKQSNIVSTITNLPVKSMEHF